MLPFKIDFQTSNNNKIVIWLLLLLYKQQMVLKRAILPRLKSQLQPSYPIPIPLQMLPNIK